MASDIFNGSVDPENMMAVRQRNESLGQLLPILVVIMACIREQTIKVERDYETANPRPAKEGIQAWTSLKKMHVAEYDNFLTFVTELHEAISTRLSASQSNLRAKASEVSHGLN